MLWLSNHKRGLGMRRHGMGTAHRATGVVDFWRLIMAMTPAQTAELLAAATEMYPFGRRSLPPTAGGQLGPQPAAPHRASATSLGRGTRQPRLSAK